MVTEKPVHTLYVSGVTQDDIDEERLVHERNMLSDMEFLFKSGRNFEYKDEKGATPVCTLYFALLEIFFTKKLVWNPRRIPATRSQCQGILHGGQVFAGNWLFGARAW